MRWLLDSVAAVLLTLLIGALVLAFSTWLTFVLAGIKMKVAIFILALIWASLMFNSDVLGAKPVSMWVHCALAAAIAVLGWLL